MRQCLISQFDATDWLRLMCDSSLGFGSDLWTRVNARGGLWGRQGLAGVCRLILRLRTGQRSSVVPRPRHDPAHRETRRPPGQEPRQVSLLAIDHRFIIVTTASFSWSAKKTNVEFGVLIDNRNLTEAAEEGLYKPEDLLFEKLSSFRTMCEQEPTWPSCGIRAFCRHSPLEVGSLIAPRQLAKRGRT